jgi:fucose permease
LDDSLSPPRPRATWAVFSYLALWAYILYGLGSATPYLRDDLRLTAFEAGLHASALAIGTLLAGASADAMARRIGSGWLLDLAVAVMTVAVVLIVVAPGLPVSLCGALLLGVGGGTLGTHANVELGRTGEAESRKLLGQANAWSMVAAAAAPLAIGLAASGLHAWRLALLVPIVGLLAMAALRRRRGGATVNIHPPRSSLPRAYWIAWFFLVIGVSIEFSFVFWGSTIVAKRTGISSADATLLASLFVVGMFAGRTAIGRGFGGGRAPRGLLAAGLGVVLVGASLVWISTVPVISGIGLFAGGLGTAGMWPIGLTVALQSAPRAHLQAAARSTLGSGFAILFAPSALGLAADAVGVVAAWPITLGLALGGLLVLAVAPRVR